MTGLASRRSRGRRSIATVAPTITKIATPTLPMMSNVVPLCGPANNSSDIGSSGIPPDPLPMADAAELLGDGPPSAMLFNASWPARSRD
jgi:hypothetical protein